MISIAKKHIRFREHRCSRDNCFLEIMIMLLDVVLFNKIVQIFENLYNYMSTYTEII